MVKFNGYIIIRNYQHESTSKFSNILKIKNMKEALGTMAGAMVGDRMAIKNLGTLAIVAMACEDDCDYVGNQHRTVYITVKLLESNIIA